ncbi:MAG: acyltransferase, partial [Planctomycetaceae bacterium]|nr:acyltransferase [Planctomycetaceae bacterium]
DRPRGMPSAPGRAGTSPGRIAELDALRGLAALAVVIFHANPAWLPMGWAAVDLFFVLSGYLITSIILRDGDSPGFLRTFYIRRGLRTWPIYYLIIAVVIALSPVLHRPAHWPGLPYLLTYTQGLSRAWSGSATLFSTYLGHTWTLAIEEQFYLLWPALVLAAGRRRLALLALACAAGSAWARGHGFAMETLLARSDGLALGGWLAAIRHTSGTPARWTKGVRVALGMLGVLALGTLAARQGLGSRGLGRSPGLTVLAFNLAWLGTLDFVLTHSGHLALRPLRWPPLRQLGQVSYGLYLYHLPILLIAVDIGRGLGLPGKLYGLKVLAALACVPVAALSWRFIERPLLDRKDRFAYRPTPDRAEAVSGPWWARSARRDPRGRDAAAVASKSLPWARFEGPCRTGFNATREQVIAEEGGPSRYH